MDTGPTALLDCAVGDVSARRERCLDAFRGLTVAGMIIVNNPGNDTPYAPLEHAAWHGWTPTDLIFPFFVFILGAAVPYAFTRRLKEGASRAVLLRQTLKRAAVLFGLGLVMNAWYLLTKSDAVFRIPGVLQRLAVCYAASSALFLYMTPQLQAAASFGGLLAYWLLLRWWGDLTPAGNLPAIVDRFLLGKHLYTPAFDPEGVLSTLPAIAQSQAGVLTALWLRCDRSDAKKTSGMAAAGAILAVLGLAWSPFFPINKALWTSSYVLFTTGLALLALAGLHWLIDLRGKGVWSKPFEALGVSALAAYILSGMGVRLMHLWHLARPDGSAGNLRYWLTDHLFAPWLSPQAASLGFSLAYLTAWILVFRALYKRNIIIKV